VDESAMLRVTQSIRKYSNAPIFFSSISYDAPVSFGRSRDIGNEVVLVSAIANNYLFREHCSERFNVLRHFTFEDHHYYSDEDVSTINAFARSKQASILTTEKDMVRLLEHKGQIEREPWHYLPIKVQFLKGENDFYGMILEKLRAHKIPQ